MTAKENIEKIVRDSIKPYKENKRKMSELSTDIEVTEERPKKQKIVIRSFDNKKIVYFFLFLYIFVALIFLAR